MYAAPKLKKSSLQGTTSVCYGGGVRAVRATRGKQRKWGWVEKGIEEGVAVEAKERYGRKVAEKGYMMQTGTLGAERRKKEGAAKGRKRTVQPVVAPAPPKPLSSLTPWSHPVFSRHLASPPMARPILPPPSPPSRATTTDVETCSPLTTPTISNLSSSTLNYSTCSDSGFVL